MSVVVAFASTAEGFAALRCAIAEAAERHVNLWVVGPLADDHEAQALVDASGLTVVIRAAGDHLAETLLEIAIQSSAELVVIGLRRRSPVGKLILGSQAQQILLEAPCPVLAVRASS